VPQDSQRAHHAGHDVLHKPAQFAAFIDLHLLAPLILTDHAAAADMRYEETHRPPEKRVVC
jgi:hypothetical protein